MIGSTMCVNESMVPIQYPEPASSGVEEPTVPMGRPLIALESVYVFHWLMRKSSHRNAYMKPPTMPPMRPLTFLSGPPQR